MNKALLKENRKHGDPIFPLSIYSITCPPEEPLLDLHWHDELEFLVVTEGRAVFRVDVHDYEVGAGEAIFVNAGELHSGYVAGGEICSFLAVVFHPDLLGSGAVDLVQDQYIHPLIQQKYAVPVHLAGRSAAERDVLSLLAQLFEAHRMRMPAMELMAKGLLCLAVTKLLQLGGPAAAERRPDAGSYRIDRLKAVVAYIERRYAEPIALKDLAALVSMSEAYFCRFFKKITTKSPIEYINLYRVQQAAIKLRRSDKKVMEIALDVGFNNLSYFNAVFKQRFGCTPAAYRRREQQAG